MAVRLETFKPYPQEREPKPVRVSERKAGEILIQKIRDVQRRPDHPKFTSEGAPDILNWNIPIETLFEITSEPDGLIPAIKGKTKLSSLEKTKLQEVGLKVMKGYGLDEERFENPRMRNGVTRDLNVRIYEAERNSGSLLFTRYMTVISGKPRELTWSVTFKRLLLG